MSRTPLLFVSTHTVDPGLTDEELSGLVGEYVTFVQASEPRPPVLRVSVSADRRELSYVHLARDGDAMERHLRVAGERVHAVVGVLPPTSLTVCGTPGPLLRQALAANASQGATVRVFPTELGGLSGTPATTPVQNAEGSTA